MNARRNSLVIFAFMGIGCERGHFFKGTLRCLRVLLSSRAVHSVDGLQLASVGSRVLSSLALGVRDLHCMEPSLVWSVLSHTDLCLVPCSG